MTIAQAAGLLLQNHIGGLPVVDEQQQVVGVITETEVRTDELGRQPIQLGIRGDDAGSTAFLLQGCLGERTGQSGVGEVDLRNRRSIAMMAREFRLIPGP